MQQWQSEHPWRISSDLKHESLSVENDFRAIAAQIPIDEQGTPMDHVSLRLAVATFALETQCGNMTQLRDSYDQVIQTASNKSWEEYWEEARQPGEWVDYIFIQVTASYLLRDIVIGNHQNIRLDILLSLN